MPEQFCPLMAVQSALVQQVPFGMQLLAAGHTREPLAHEHVPPGAPTHVWPTTVQSLVAQHELVGMHVLALAQTF